MKEYRLIRRFHFWWCIVLLTVLTVGICWPMEGPIRSASPSSIESIMINAELKPVHLAQAELFSLAVGGDIALLERPIQIQDLSDATLLKKAQDNAKSETRAYRVISDLAFSFVTYGEHPDDSCSVQLVVDSGIKSDILYCSHIRDNDLAHFHFSEKILPGIYKAHFIWAKKGPGNLGVYAWRGKQSQPWLSPFTQKPSLSTARILGDWFNYEPLRASCYFLTIIVTIAIALFAPARGVTVLATAFMVYLGSLAIVKEFSGHDETAHLTMLREVMLPDIDSAAFNKEAAATLMERDFYRLHNARQIKPGECPHSVLTGGYDCGVTDYPKHLYSVYNLLSKTLRAPVNASPMSLLWVGRIANLGTLTLVVLILFVMFGEVITYGLGFLMLFMGAYLSQFASISNDPTMLLYAIFSALGMTALLSHKYSKSKTTLYFIFQLSFLYGASFVDRSFIAGVPLVFCMPAIIFLSRKRLDEKSNSSLFWPLGLSILTFAAILYSMILFQPITQFLVSNTIFQLATYVKDINLLQNLSKFTFISSLNAYWIWLRSLLGSFVWGHTYYPISYALFLSLIFTGFFIKGFQYLAVRFGKIVGSSIAILISICIAAQGVAILAAVLIPLDSNTIGFESFLKPRLTSPGIAVFLIPALLGLNLIIQNNITKKLVCRVISLWAVLLLSHYLPFVFLKDLY